MRTGLLTPSTRRPGRRSTQDSGGEERTAYYSSLGWTVVQYWWYVDWDRFDTHTPILIISILTKYVETLLSS